MTTHVMDADNACRILSSLQRAGVEPTVGGGWAIDALLGEQSRLHSDLDLWVAAEDLEPLIRAFVDLGLDRLLPWGGDRPWNFVVHDGGALRVDLHLYEKLPDGRVHYGSVRGGDDFDLTFLRGHGAIDGMPVACDSPGWALLCHTGYPPRSVDHEDVRRLCAKFRLPIPDAFQ
jgi:lincosamide nucleotidyltransferase A/C/D/E